MKKIQKSENTGVPVFLAEFSVAILIFALCAAFCAGAFFSSASLSASTKKLDAAVLLTEQRIARLKLSNEPAAAAFENLPNEGLRFVTTPKPADPGLAKARIEAFDSKTGKRIYESEAAWQISLSETPEKEASK